MKVLVSDYDKTFYLNEIDLDKNLKMVKEFRKHGNIFVFATGRSFLDFKKVKEKHNLEYDYLILNHGATILDNNDNTLFNIPISNEIINNLKNDLDLEKAKEYFCCSALDSRTNFNHNDLTKIRVVYNSIDEAKKINELLNKKFSDYINSYIISNMAIEIISNKTDKAIAITHLLKKLNINKKCIFTIGDSYSDLTMIKDFNGYSIKNSIKDIKEYSVKEVDSVSDLLVELNKL